VSTVKTRGVSQPIRTIAVVVVTYNSAHLLADLVVEIVSPGDESREKFGFYFRAGVKEFLIVDPDAHTVEWFVRTNSEFHLAERSNLLSISTAELAKAIDWPEPT
jgi:Uma2 family endonuclease